MKKLFAIFLSLVLVLGLCGCSIASLAGGDSSASSEAVSAAPSSTEESSESAETNSIEEGGETPTPAPEPTDTPATGELPEPDGSAEFKAAFKDNDIDKKYSTDIDAAVAVTDMLSITSSASNNWEAMVNKAYDDLMAAVADDADKTSEYQMEQQAWTNELGIAMDEIKASVTDSGSLANVDIAYKTMVYYRARAAAILAHIYDINGKIDIQVLTGEAVG